MNQNRSSRRRRRGKLNIGSSSVNLPAIVGYKEQQTENVEQTAIDREMG
jgi:hypothetical protein